MINQRGDTIVEVLISMLIVSVVLGGAYASSNRSLQTTQSSKERDSALRVAEAQLERLREADLASVPIAPNSFCLNGSAALVNNPNPLVPSVDSDDLSEASPNYHDDCQVTTGGGVAYNTAIVKNGDVYEVHVRWNRVGGGSNQETILRYR